MVKGNADLVSLGSWSLKVTILDSSFAFEKLKGLGLIHLSLNRWPIYSESLHIELDLKDSTFNYQETAKLDLCEDFVKYSSV